MVLSRRDQRSAGAGGIRGLPWTVGFVLLVATLVASYLSWRNVQDEQQAALDASTSLFQSTVAETETRLGLEQSKLMFFLNGVAAWAQSSGDPAEADLDSYMASLPIEDRVPALRLVVLTQMDGSGSTIMAATSPTGEPMEEFEGTAVADYPGFDLAMQGEASSIPVEAIRLGTETKDGQAWVWLTTAVPGRPGWYVAGRFVGSVFLSPALGAGGSSAALRPAGADFVITRPGMMPPDASGVATNQIGTTPNGEMFTYAGEVEVFGSAWRLDVLSSGDFLEIPESREYWVWLLGGFVVSMITVGLVALRQRDVRRELSVNAALARSSRRFTTGFDNSPIGMAEVNVDGRIVRANNTMRIQLGRSALVGTELAALVHESDVETHTERFDELRVGDAASAQLDVRYVLPDGRLTWVTESISALDRADDHERHFLVQQLDTTDRREAEMLLHRQAFTDELTGLPNRAALFDTLAKALVSADSNSSQLALVFIDLDRFKVVNDSLGHGSGDDLLRIVAQRIVRQVPSEHLVGRFGGDEFVVVCPDAVDEAGVTAFAEGILTSIRQPIELRDAPVQITASAGYTFSKAGDTAETMLRDADAAMYKAKARGKNSVQRFGSPIRQEAVERLDLERALRQALDRDEFEVWYQPMVELNSDKVVGVEALLRWRHPKRGLLEPARFLGIAREVGLLDEIDRRTLSEAWLQLDEWSHRAAAASDWHLSVNCSPNWFLDGRLRDLLPDVLDSCALDPERLWLEVTESDLLSDGHQATEQLDALHDLGVKVAIDDFGTGFSSLSYLSRFDVDRLKIDKSFVASLGRGSADEAIVSAVIDMADALGIATVAEGTESAEQLDAVRRLGADYAQGFVLSRPRPAHEIEEALELVG